MLPTFMPVATQAAIKGLTSQQMESLGVTLILNNTYHLNLRPGLEVLTAAGGAHKFQGWNRNLLTVRVPQSYGKYLLNAFRVLTQDSGGFQLVSLSKFTTISEEGALFASPFTGEPTMLSVGNKCSHLYPCLRGFQPEESISIQHAIGADIIVQLDDVGLWTQLYVRTSKVGLH